jgi:hypothetical protein
MAKQFDAPHHMHYHQVQFKRRCTLCRYIVSDPERVRVLVQSAAVTAYVIGWNVIDKRCINPLTPELNPSAQRCLTRFFTGDFAS